MGGNLIYINSYTRSFTRRTNQLTGLLWSLVVRDIKARYRRSILGPIWAVLQPLMLMVVFTALRGVVEIPSDGIPPVIFSYSALVPWSFFSSAVNRAGPSVLSNKSIMQKIDVPRELFPLVGVVTALFDMAMSGIILFGMMLWFQVPLTLSLLWLPVLIILTGIFALNIGLILSAFGVYRRDFLTAGNFLMRIWLYATPIIYPISSVPEQWQFVYKLNPMVGLLEGFRTVVAVGQAPDLNLLALSLPGIILTGLIGLPIYRLMSNYFTDVL